VKARGATVIVVDDDASVRRSLERLLRAAGHRVETFASARELLDRHDSDRPDCLVLDVRMPGLTGLDAHEAMVAAGHDIPVIFITGHGDIPLRGQAMKAGAVDFLPKPFDDQAFLDAIQQALAKGGTARGASASGGETVDPLDER
jgi:FixJ family two-component response regulator